MPENIEEENFLPPGEDVSDNVNNEGSQDLSDVSSSLNDLIELIKKEQEERKQKEEELKKQEEEELKKQEELQKEESDKEEELNQNLDIEKEQSQLTMQTLVDNSMYLESINTLLQEQVFLNKLSFVGLGVGIALVSVMIFQNSFKR